MSNDKIAGNEERVEMENSNTFGVSIFRSRIGEGGNISRRVYNLILGACLI